MQVLARAEQFSLAGHQVVHFEVGEPDFATAPPIVEAGQQALEDGLTKYTAATGIAPLREAIAQYYADWDVRVDPQRIVVTGGASGGLTLLTALLLNPRDELLITDPGYPCNEVFARMVGAVPKTIQVGPDTLFQPRPDDVAAAWGPATRALLLASPANPTGTVIGRSALAQIHAVVQQRDGFFILDEIYQGLYSARHAGMAEYRSGLEVAQDIYVLNSFSKFFGMTGWRLGWIVVPSEAVEPVTRLAQNLFISPSTPAQYAALAAFETAAMDIHQQRARAFQQRAELLVNGLKKLGFGIPVMPQGAFYAYVDVSHTGLNSRDFCWRLLDEYYVAVTPGEDFGAHNSDRYVRFAFTTDEASIHEGLTRIDKALCAWGAG